MKNQTQPDLLRPRWSKVVADLWGNKFRTLLVVASITVGVFAIGMIATAYTVLSQDIDLSFESTNPANIEISTDPFDQDFLNGIEQAPGVAQAEGRRVMTVRTSLDGVDWQNQALYGIEDFEDMRISHLGVVEGTIRPQKGELLVSKDFMNDSGYKLGDLIQVKFPDGETRTLPLVGLIASQGKGADPSSGAAAYVTLDTLESYGQGDFFNSLVVTTSGDNSNLAQIDALAERLENKIEDDQRSVYRMATRVSDEHPFRSMALAIFGVLGALGALITVLSSTLIINTLNALLVQHMRQIGVMKLVGGRSRQIMGMYLTLIFFYGLLALAIAAPSGTIAGYALAELMAYMMNVTLQGFRVIPIAIVLQTLIAFLIPLAAGYFPVRRGARINVRRAISNASTEKPPTELGWLNQVARRLPWLSRPVLLSIRNTFRQRGRLALTIFTLTIAGAVFIAVFNVRDSMSNFMDQLAQHFMGDVTVNLSQPYPIQRVEKVVRNLPEVTGVEAWGGASGEIWNAEDEMLANLAIIAPPVDTQLLNPDIVAGRWLLPDEEKALVVSDAIYNTYPDLQPGDAIRVKLPGKRTDEWTVVGVFRFIDMIGDTLAYADPGYLAGLQGMQGRSSSYRLIIDDHTLESQKALAQVLEGYLEANDLSVGSVRAGLTLQEDSSKSILVLVSFLLVMALLTAFVGSIGLTGTMGMNVLERTREIGVMRAIGAVDFEIIKSVVIEGVLIGLITWVLAIGLSFPISTLLLRIISASMMGSVMATTFTPLGIFIWLGVVIALSFFASILPARNAARLTINEVLAYE